MDNVRGNRLGEAMHARGVYKLSVLAALLGVTESAVSRWRHSGAMTVENVACADDDFLKQCTAATLPRGRSRPWTGVMSA
jgi:predicted transcriptional regulator